jgi:hypothetical protein
VKIICPYGSFRRAIFQCLIKGWARIDVLRQAALHFSIFFFLLPEALFVINIKLNAFAL